MKSETVVGTVCRVPRKDTKGTGSGTVCPGGGKGGRTLDFFGSKGTERRLGSVFHFRLTF